MISVPLSAVAAETAPSAFSLQTLILGVLTVLIAYALIAIAGLRRQLAELSVPAKPAPVQSAPAAAPQPSAGMTPELLAVIAAAIHVTLGDTRHRIVSLSPASQVRADQTSAWSVEGRRQVFQSHKVR